MSDDIIVNQHAFLFFLNPLPPDATDSDLSFATEKHLHNIYALALR